MLAGLLTLWLSASPLTVNPPSPGRGAPELVSPYRGYRVKLRPLVVSLRDVGLMVEARVNGGPPLHLLLDSGAQYVVLDRKAAARSVGSGGIDLDLVVPGSPRPEPARMVRAATVEIGGLALRNVTVAVVGYRLAEGIDGALPLSLFAGFLIRLDVAAKSLELQPYPSEHYSSELAAGSELGTAIASNDLLFVKCLLNGTRQGLFLLDTGASYNAISTKLAHELIGSMALAPKVLVRGGSASMEAPVFQPGLRLRLGGREFRLDSALAVDLSTASRYHNLEVAGLIGYPGMRHCVLTVNYRDALVRIGPE